MDAHQFWSKDYEIEIVSEISLIDVINISLLAVRSRHFFLRIHWRHIEPLVFIKFLMIVFVEVKFKKNYLLVQHNVEL